LYRTTAEQTNAAFGGIDWSKMPVNKTGQDILRLLVLAEVIARLPTTLLARWRIGRRATVRRKVIWRTWAGR